MRLQLRSWVHSIAGGALSKKQINMRLAPEEESDRLSGYMHNAVTPVGCRTPVPVRRPLLCLSQLQRAAASGLLHPHR